MELPEKGDYPTCNTGFQSKGQTEDNMAGQYQEMNGKTSGTFN